LQFLIIAGEETGGRGKVLEKVSESGLFHLRTTSFVIERGHYKNGTFLFAEKDRGLDPHYPLITPLVREF